MTYNELIINMVKIVVRNSTDPATEMRRLGNALMQMSRQLQGRNAEDCLKMLRLTKQIIDGKPLK